MAQLIIKPPVKSKPLWKLAGQLKFRPASELQVQCDSKTNITTTQRKYKSTDCEQLQDLK